MYHMVVGLQYEKTSSYSILNFLISLFACPGHRPTLHIPALNESDEQV